MTDYIGLADTAKLMRKALAKNFPGVKFYVRSKSYSGGSSINVYYDGLDHYDPPITCVDHGLRSPGDYCATDGVALRWTPVYRPGMPTKDAVDAVVGGFASRGFDGMIDGSYMIDAVVSPDGDVLGTSSTGSYASVPAWDTDAVGTKVHFGASFVFVNDMLPYGVRKAA